MRFRILTNGTLFRIEQKVWMGWDDLADDGPVGRRWVSGMLFHSDGEAVKHIRENYGSQAQIDRPWTISVVAEIEVDPSHTPDMENPA